MDTSIIILSLSLSIDALGIGISYGMKDINIPIVSKIIISAQSFLIIALSLFMGNKIFQILPSYVGKYTGTIILLSMGIFMIFQGISSKKEKQETTKIFSIKQWGITVKIIKSPPICDFNRSKKIEPKEAIYLGLALSLDSLGVSLGSGISGKFSIFLPLFAVIFQSLFMQMGVYSGKKIKGISKLSENIWVIISGSLLILIGILKFI